MSRKEALSATLSFMLLCAAFPSAAAERDSALHHAHYRYSGYDRSERRYHIPDAILTDAYGKSVSLAQELEADEPVMLNFFYTRCTTLCPPMSASFAEVQRQLGREVRHLRLFSITIDPEHDTSSRLRAYASQHRAGPGWMLFTGRRAEIDPVVRAFEGYGGDLEELIPVTYMRTSSRDPWVRIDGLASASQLIAEFRRLQRR